MADINNQPMIQSVTFHDNGVEIVYAEPQDVERLGDSGILRTRVVMCPPHLVEDELRDATEALVDLLDKILIVERNPQPPTARR